MRLKQSKFQVNCELNCVSDPHCIMCALPIKLAGWHVQNKCIVKHQTSNIKNIIFQLN